MKIQSESSSPTEGEAQQATALSCALNQAHKRFVALITVSLSNDNLLSHLSAGLHWLQHLFSLLLETRCSCLHITLEQNMTTFTVLCFSKTIKFTIIHHNRLENLSFFKKKLVSNHSFFINIQDQRVCFLHHRTYTTLCCYSVTDTIMKTNSQQEKWAKSDLNLRLVIHFSIIY